MAVPDKARYWMIRTTEYVEDVGSVTTYGIGYQEDAPGDKHGENKYRIIAGISTEPGFVEELVDKLNRHDAAPIHLLDFVYDHLP